MNHIKPLVKWAGGKTQILPYLKSKVTDDIENYAEPFVGGGALLFSLYDKPNIKNIYICDSNKDLMLIYEIVRDYSDDLVCYLQKIENEYNKKNASQREIYYYTIRERFNKDKNKKIGIKNKIKRAAQMLFLNRACFNGLWRVNSNTGHFNVPFNKAGITEKNGALVAKPYKFCFEENIIKAGKFLKERNTAIHCGDYHNLRQWEFFNHPKTLIYFDPPYRPISKTSSFVKYSKEGFNDAHQKQLADFFWEAQKEQKVILSNSNPQQFNPADTFFRDLYDHGSIRYEILQTNRLINSKTEDRKKVSEILIHN